MSLLPDFHTRVLDGLNKELKNLRDAHDGCPVEKHEWHVGGIRATNRAIAIVNAEYKRVGGDE